MLFCPGVIDTSKPKTLKVSRTTRYLHKSLKIASMNFYRMKFLYYIISILLQAVHKAISTKILQQPPGGHMSTPGDEPLLSNHIPAFSFLEI